MDQTKRELKEKEDLVKACEDQILKMKKQDPKNIKDLEEIEKTAREFEDETKVDQKKADRFDFGEIILEASLVITSVTLLTKIRYFWFIGILTAFIGVFISGSGFWVH